ncbi:Galactoside 2-alpha-L-fucosyltransferase, putative [Ricinus communis]|uniref:Fucosyltransferase n=1 Tax=Ricinus communis TaxID=3988 RepID=B9SML7_RICCO|nr:Galactoside 2-alpha-L-fucosyltransferase, putative [Ricinus communis]|eukprot:XP_002527236.1 galactoside 2-alpha-L-fucosyltransferase [Ricinus communis]
MEDMPVKKLLGWSTMRTISLATCLVAFPLMIMLSVNYQDDMFDLIGKVKVLGGKAFNVTQFGIDSKPESSQPASHSDVLLGGLLASGFDQESCLSRYQSVLYRRPSPKKPSPYLISKLRNYEKLHKKCEPHSESYNSTLKLLGSPNISGPTECSYMVWTAQEGLGNRILTMASAFLYALLANKVLLVEFYPDMVDLFCEPFPNTSWLLPQDFPSEFRWSKNRPTFGNLLRSKTINASTELPPSQLFIFLAARLDFFDLLFYCEDNHALLQKVPWLFLKSDEYFLPSFFLIPSFQEELDRMFPDKESVFHHLGRYLFHPSNKAWGLITRFYESYLAKAEERIAIQVRVFKPKASPFDRLMDQILACTFRENLLPEVDKQTLVASPLKNRTSKAILIASLYSKFYENITNMYWTFPTKRGEIIGVHQPSHEEHQYFGDNMHNMKAWVEMNLLGMSDVLVTSSGSTFGYVAQGLAGLTPWILSRPESWKASDPACHLGLSMEPCLHIPPSYDCKAKANADMGNAVPYVRHCEDLPSGLKLVNK